MLGVAKVSEEHEEEICVRKECTLSADAEPTSHPASSVGTLKPWLAGLLTADLFKACRSHPTQKKNECKFFCECCTPITGRAMCRHCLEVHDRTCCSDGFQIRRYMYQNVVHAEDLAVRYDISRVQQYSINERKAILIHPKVAPVTARTAPAFSNECRSCSVPLNPERHYCCLKCKVDLDYGVEPPTPVSNTDPGLSVASYGVQTATPLRTIRAYSALDGSESRSTGAQQLTESPGSSTGGSKRRKADRPQRSHLM